MSGSDLRKRRALPALAMALVAIFSAAVGGNFGTGSSAVSTYGADAGTLLFDDFEDSRTQGVAVSAGVGFDSGYIQGRALKLHDTGAFVTYSDSWWSANGAGFQESGTIEFYFRPDSFLYTGTRPYGLLLTMDDRESPPARSGLPTLAARGAGNLSWAVSQNTAAYREALYSSEPPLNPGQWYHIAATWESGLLQLFINDTRVATAVSDTSVRKDTFYIGGRGTIAMTEGLAARGLIDRLRLSSRVRALGEFPVALTVRIDSPSGGENLARPCPLTVRAFASDSRPRTVDIYADTDKLNFNGTLIAPGLPESGTFLVGGGLTDTRHFLYAVARAGNDSAYFIVPQSVTLSSTAGYSAVVDPSETTASVTPAPAAADSFLLVGLTGGGRSSGSLVSLCDSIGTGANYSIKSRLSQGGDSVTIHIWTKQATGGLALGLRSDTASLLSALPRGIPNSERGRTTFGATAVSLEFFRENGTMYGDTRTTTALGETYAYSLDYQLSETTTALFRELGFDVSVGAGRFAFFYADTYGANWTEDTTVTVRVASVTTGAGCRITVTGITRDLPGGLGAPGSASAAINAARGTGCVIRTSGAPGFLQALFRAMRDLLLDVSCGRVLVEVYYLLSGMVA